MAEAHEVQLPLKVSEGASETIIPNGVDSNLSNQSRTAIKIKTRYQHWLRIALRVVLVFVGQSSAILLGRLYYQEGGNSKWIGSLVQLLGFPILLPLYIIPASKNPTTKIAVHNDDNPPSAFMLAFVYVFLGLLLALDCFLYATGLAYLPVSTYSLICSSKLAFNAFFSFFLNSLKFTPCIVNSVVLLTISSILLVFQTGSSTEYSSTEVSSKKKYLIGFISTVGASAGYGLLLSLTQLAFNKVMKKESFKGILDMVVYQALVASLVTLVGLFCSGEFRDFKAEMEEFEKGKASYVLTLSFTAITWQVYAVGCLSLILEVSSLFSNAIGTLGLPIVPVLAVLFFHDSMNGLKVISLVVAVWGFLSYVYQQYLDQKTNSKTHQHIQKE
ncbi:probable purine permease 10 [Prosopis cineraria]|uniref:probable purine permease 10 n=1 Tax=Prosopis cineraria TaxID=364024 RepID=UPI00240F5374|nr:probable purine permease 10 [Prosopis cineraria]